MAGVGWQKRMMAEDVESLIMPTTIVNASKSRKDRRLTNARSNAARRDVYHRRLSCEMLEDRRLLSGMTLIAHGVGSHTIAASYSSDANFSGSLSEHMPDGAQDRSSRRLVLASTQQASESAQWISSGTGSIAWGTDNPYFGSTYLKISPSSDGTATSAIFTPTASIAANGGLMFQFRCDGNSNDFNHVKFYLYPDAADAGNYYCLEVNLGDNTWDGAWLDHQWRLCCLGQGYNNSDTGPSWTPVRNGTLPVWGSPGNESLTIEKLVIEVKADSGKTPVLRLGQIATNIVQHPVPIVFTFDDGFASVVTKALPLMQAAGLTGVMAVNMSQAGTTDTTWSIGNEYATVAQLQTAQAAGWDVISHGSPLHEDVSYWAHLDESTVTNLLTNNLDQMRQAGLNGVNYVIWPGGGLDSRQHLGSDIADALGFKLRLGVGESGGGHVQMSLNRTNWGTCGLESSDPRQFGPRISPNPAYEDITEVEPRMGEPGQGGMSLEQYLNKTLDSGSPIIFHMYNIVDTVTTAGEISTAQFNQLVAWAVAKIAAGEAVNCGMEGLELFTIGATDTVPPTVSSWTLTDDTGISSTDKITNDTTPILAFKFSEIVNGQDDDVSVLNPNSIPVSPDSIGGWGTDTLTVTFGVALVTDGQYTVTLRGTSTIRDTAGNPLNNGADEVVHFTLDTTPPTVTRVLVGSGAWSSAFLTSLGAVGYAIAEGPNQVRSLPWSNINKVIVEFSENVDVLQDDLAIVGVNVPNYAFSPNSFVDDPVAHRATWTLNQCLGADKLLIDLDGNTANAVTDAAGNCLDGQWRNPTWNPPSPPAGGDAWPSGDGKPGGNFLFRLNVLPGDGNQSGGVDVRDVQALRAAVFSNVGDTKYSPLLDLDGSGGIDIRDVQALRNCMFTELSENEPSVPMQQPGSMMTPAADRKAVVDADTIPLTEPAFQPLVIEAITRWAVAGLSGQGMDAMTRAKFVVTDLPGAELGLAGDRAIYMDHDAAGYGWFVAPTPAKDEKFARRSSANQLQAVDSQAVDRMDLLSAVEHELGHLAGLDDLDWSASSLMSGSLSNGIHRISLLSVDAQDITGIRVQSKGLLFPSTITAKSGTG
jgi:hypothetical protein